MPYASNHNRYIAGTFTYASSSGFFTNLGTLNNLPNTIMMLITKLYNAYTP